MEANEEPFAKSKPRVGRTEMSVKRALDAAPAPAQDGGDCLHFCGQFPLQIGSELSG